MQRAEETGFSGHWRWRQAIRFLLNYASSPLFSGHAQWREDRLAALAGKGPGLTPSHDDTLSGMLLAAGIMAL